MKTTILLLASFLYSTLTMAQTFTVDGLNYSVISNDPNEVEITGGTSIPSNLNIPTSVVDNGITYTVTTIRNSAFSEVGLQSVSIPNSVTRLGSLAFFGNQLTSVTLPPSVNFIDFACFASNTGFTAVDAQSNTPPTIRSTSFGGRDNIRLTVPPGTEAAYEAAGWTDFFSVNGVIPPFEIGERFQVANFSYQVTSLTPLEVSVLFSRPRVQDLVIPASVSIGSQTFTVTEVGPRAFQSDPLTSLSLPNTIVNIRQDAFENTGLTSLSLPESVITIGNAAFRNNALTSLVIPDSVTSIGTLVFFGNPLTSITSLNETPATIEANTFDNRNSTTLIIPEGTEQAYLDTGWTDFQTVLPDRFTVDNLNYEIISLMPAKVTIIRSVSISGSNLVIPEFISFSSINWAVTAVGDQAFEDLALRSIVLPSTLKTIGFQSFGSNGRFDTIIIPENVTTIGDGAFGSNSLGKVIVLNASPITIDNQSNDPFGRDRGATDLEVPVGTEAAYRAAGWTGFRSINGVQNLDLGSNFIDGNFDFTITSLDNREVVVVGGSSFPKDLVIPAAANSGGIEFTVVGVANNAFRDSELTSLNLPSTLKFIASSAFVRNQLQTITILENITSIGSSAFRANPLTKVIALSETPAQITTAVNSIFSDSFGNFRENIDLIIPIGTTQAYLNEDWTGFKSVNELDTLIHLNIKAFLQGATNNLNSGETNLMRDDLRIADLIPTTSPYPDKITVNTIAANENPAKNYIDWVFVELRDPQDSSIVIQSKSAFLQRDGEIVNTDGTPLCFLIASGDYFVSIKHRNHLAIITANPILLSTANTNLDFTNNTNLVEGGSVALQQVGNVFTMIAGDTNSDGQVLSTDIIQVVSEIGTSGYSNTDLDMNGQILSTDIIIGNQNIGRGEQFSEPVQAP